MNEITDKEKKYLMHTYSREIVLEKGKGCYVFDSEGKKYLDLISGIGCTTVGHCNEKVNEAISEAADKLINPSNLFYTEPQVLLAEKLARISGLNKCFFSNSGSEANEAAIKLARKFTGKKEIISSAGGFHGRTMGALSATHKEKYKKYCEPLVPGFKHIPFNDTCALKNAVNEHTAAFIVEPVQGETGIIIPDKGYLKELRKICSQNKVLLILDEVQSGNGRTGKFFAYQHEDILPDIVTLAKGMANGVPIAVTIAAEKIADAFVPGDQGSTFGGNCLACSAALATIEFIFENNLMKNAAETGDYFTERLNEFNLIREIRSKGLMIAIEFNDEETAKKVFSKCIEHGILLNKVTATALRLLPSLIISKKEVDFAVDVFKEIFDELK
ncbi:aspartate aminotransferase family protein [Candidatus Woesearchaeota archaeon]|nr:aspartate aminotransferase family protein [Candidatus Woesearchaeota archaeon]